jgi:NHLM bacteriocin system ABC transporter peptidase/ATP-binding protein
MLQYDVILTSIGVAFVGVNVTVLRWVSRQRVDANMRLMQEQGKVSGVSISGLQSMETLKASGLESDFFSKWAGYYAKATNARQEMDTTNQLLGVLPSLLTSITAMLLLAVGGLRVMDGALSVGMLVAFQGMMQRFLEPVNNLVSLASEVQEMEGNLNRLDDVLRNSVDSTVEQEVRSLTPPTHLSDSVRLQGYVELRNLTFGYNRSAPPLIENLSLTLKPGQRVALVGGSGSGKSTVAKLVCGLYEPWQGEILFDGQPRNQIPRPVITHSLALVEQDISLFAGSVRDNLTLWDSTVPFSNLVRACRDAAIQDVVLSMPGGYNADLAEGATNLSGGQRQRLEIARAMVNNPSILVMDEATSALDAETEKIIDQKLRERGCTCIIVAHRLSTIRDCDEIIVFDRGKVVQRGTHNQLQQVEGKYLQLIRSEGEALQEESPC